jgi:hypothetical protein
MRSGGRGSVVHQTKLLSAIRRESNERLRRRRPGE